MRKIIHIDMDAFYASVEQKDNPALRGKPIAVGGSKLRGVVAAASYEARKFGVRSAMPSVTAARKCPALIFVRPRFDRYKEISLQIREIFYEFTDLVQPLSLDEAYLDVTNNKFNEKSAILVAKRIRKKIYEKTGLTASAGVSINKFVAKIASDINKPNGMKVILPEEVIPFLETLAIDKFFGIGKVTSKKMRKMGITNGLELKALSEIELAKHFGKQGRFYYRMVRGEDNRPVNPSQIRKSISVENTFTKNLVVLEEMQEELKTLANILAERIARSASRGYTLTLKIKYADFSIANRSKTVKHFLTDELDLFQLSSRLLADNLPPNAKVRLLGIGVSNLVNEGSNLGKYGQLSFDF